MGRKVRVQVSKPGVEVSEANATHVDSSSVDVVEAELEAVGDGNDHTCGDEQRSVRRGEDGHDHSCHSAGTHLRVVNHSVP